VDADRHNVRLTVDRPLPSGDEAQQLRPSSSSSPVVLLTCKPGVMAEHQQRPADDSSDDDLESGMPSWRDGFSAEKVIVQEDMWPCDVAGGPHQASISTASRLACLLCTRD
jgi:hypothetical protein